MPLATATLRRTRRLAAASLLAAAALSLTACQSGGDPAPAASSSSAGDPAPADGGAKGGSAASSSGGSSSGGSSSGGSASGGSSAGSRQTSAAGGSGSAPGKGASRTGAGQTSAPGGSGGGASAGNKGVGGTWVGTLKWLTDDKLTVAPKGGMEQAFYVADSTKVLGAAALCEAPDGRVHLDGSGYGTTSCTLADLRKAARLGSVDVRVTVVNGAATKVAEHYHP
ncbi:hypothetical protein [Streptomyces lydicus]|uniref:hypothetical protein n=1 Tax=Streptomyces lydicus TaxID=47763 RepID=UPI0034368501